MSDFNPTKIVKNIEKAVNTSAQDYQKEMVAIVKNTIAKKGLIDKGKLKDSIQSKVTVKSDGVEIEIFSTDRKAKFLEDGTKHIKPQNFMKESAQEIEKKAANELSKRMKKGLK